MASIFGLGKGGLRYSLNREQFTGNYWVDGKKIYRLIQTINKTGIQTIDIGASKIETIIKLDALNKNQNEGTLSLLSSSSGNGAINGYIKGNDIILSSSTSGSRYWYYFILEYTKKTD